MRISGSDLFKFDKDLWYALEEKTEGEARQKIRTLQRKGGINAYCIIFKWYSTVTGAGIMSQTQKIMKPEKPQEENQVYRTLDEWCTSLITLRKQGE